jgi:hypothetical protein
MEAWRRAQDDKVARFLEAMAGVDGLVARAVPDPAGMPFARAHLRVDPAAAGRDAATLADELRQGGLSIRVMEHGLSDGELIFELVPLGDEEVDLIATRVAALVG